MSRRTISCFNLVTLCFFASQLPRQAQGQVAGAAISGTVLDSSGGAVANATVHAESLDNGGARSTVSSGTGAYALPSLRVGHYSLTITAVGFEKYVMENIELQVGQNRTQNVELNLASVGTRVDVQDTAPPLAATSAEMSGVVSGNQVRELPLNGRNWASLMTQTPGAIDSGQNNQHSIRFVGHGLDDNNYRFDGVDATGILNQAQKGTFRLQFSTEAIAEFRAQAALYTADSGGTEGGQVNLVSRSGTNDFHGSAFEYLRNDYFDARGPFGGAPPPLRLNQFGGSVGGPIRNDKDFFFVSYEGLRQRVGQTLIGFVPSGSFRAAAATTSPALLPFLNAFPAGTAPTTNPNVDRRDGYGTQSTNEDSGMARYDHRFSDRLSLFVRYNLDIGVSNVPNGVLLDRVSTTNNAYNAVIGLTSVLSPQTINEARFGFNRSNYGTQNESVYSIGLVAPPFSILNDNTGKIQVSNSFDWLDGISTVHGRHTIKTGLEIRRVQINATATSSNDYVYSYTNASTFLNNQIQQASLVNALPITGLRRTEYFAYVQDEYRIRPNLTANVGVRYEYFGVPGEVNGRGIVFAPLSCPGGYCPPGTSFYKGDFNNFSPRVSLAWSPTIRLVVRTGYGIFYGDGQVGDLTAPLDNLAGRALLTSGSFPIPSSVLSSNFSLNAPRALDRNRVIPYTQDWGLSVQQAITDKTVLTVGYLGSKGTKQFTRTYLNDFDPITHTRPYPQFSLIDYKSTNGNSTFNSLQATLQRNLSSSLIGTANYLYSHAINDGGTGGGEATYPENVHCRACERASSDFDVRSFLSASLIYQLPFGKGHQYLNGNGMAARVLGGWQWMNVFTARTGLPANVTLSRPTLSIPDRNSTSPQRPNVVPGLSLTPANQTVNNWVNFAAFATPAPGTFGNAGRNLIYGPDFWQYDTALSKSVPVFERLNLVFRAEAFNILNRAQYGQPNTNLSAANPGQITSVVNATGVGTGTPRQLQFALRLEF